MHSKRGISDSACSMGMKMSGAQQTEPFGSLVNTPCAPHREHPAARQAQAAAPAHTSAHAEQKEEPARPERRHAPAPPPRVHTRTHWQAPASQTAAQNPLLASAEMRWWQRGCARARACIVGAGLQHAGAGASVSHDCVLTTTVECGLANLFPTCDFVIVTQNLNQDRTHAQNRNSKDTETKLCDR